MTKRRGIDVREIRGKLGLSRRCFAERFGLSSRTVEQWEQGRSAPDGSAVTLLRVIAHAPETVARALQVAEQPPLIQILERLRESRSELRDCGVTHTAVFGSVARNEASRASDVDVLIDIDESVRFTSFTRARVRQMLERLLHRDVDIVTRRSLDAARHAQILAEAIHAF